MASANQTPGGYKFALLVASQLRRANQHEHACFELFSLWSFPSRSGIVLYTVVQPRLCNDPFCYETFRPLLLRSAAFPLVLGYSRPLVGVDIPKAPRSSRKHPIHSFSWPPTQPATPTNSMNTTLFGSLVFPMRATNSANKIRLLRDVTTMLSFPAFISVFREEIEWSARLFFRQPMQRVRKLS